MGNSESTIMESMENPDNEGIETMPMPTSAQTTRSRRRRRRFETVTITPSDENSWWYTIENANLVLEQVPNDLTPSGREARNESEIRATKQKLANENLNLTLKCVSNGVEVDENVAAATTAAATATSNENLLQNENLEQHKVARSDLSERTERAAAREQSLEEFREELRQKRLTRQTAVQDLRDEITTLRKQLAKQEQARTNTNIYQQQHQQQANFCSQRELQHVDNTSSAAAVAAMINEKDTGNVNNTNSNCNNDVEGACGCSNIVDDADDVDPMSRGRHANIELANAQLALQLANSENISLRAELGVVQKQVSTLKEVVSCCKQMLAVKEEQCNELKAKLTEIETSFGEREMKIMSENLRHEYERQLGNIRQLRELYEERQRISAAEHENLQRLISIKKDELLAQQEKTKNFEERNQTLIKEVENANNELATLREECNEHKFEKKALKEEMGAVNTLFSQMVMGFNGKNNLDIDRLTTMLEENRTLLNDMATKEASCTDGATLPKLLFELVEQAMHVGSSKTSRSTTPIPMVDSQLQETTIPTEDDDTNDDENDATKEDKASKDEVEQQEQNQKHNNENEEATNMNNDVAAAAAPTAEETSNVDAMDHAVNSVTAMKQFNITDCGSDAVADVVITTTTATTTKNSKRQQQQQRRKVQAASSSSSTAAVAASNSNFQSSTLIFYEPEVIGKVASAQEIIGNLPKVWKVLMELLSHHKIEQTQFEENGNSEDCYKSVETPNGPKAELSVSKTYIKLKDLILEKKSLVKETNRLKTLNSHLEYRLNTQEKRLSTVSMELTKTWHLVGKMQRQHRQLHTQEQILRYQLQQKRRLLSELKEELEYCRRKWAAARAKNDESQEQCNDLRREFARRKLEDANNSAESGYSDSGPPSDEEGDVGAVGGALAGLGGANDCNGAVAGAGINSRRKHLREMFEHTRKIKRMQSTSPGRAAAAAAASAAGAGAVENKETEIILRWNSAPPTCGWRRRQRENETGHGDDDDNDDDDNDNSRDSSEHEELPPRLLTRINNSRGAIPKQHGGNSRLANADVGSDTEVVAEAGAERACRIQRLEEQCKSLIQQVLETSDNRERLEIQLCRFQDEIAPVQYAVPLKEFINRKRNERMSRASSAPATGSLTPREEEYTRKRSERLERLEEESRQLMSRIKRTSDRGHYLRCSLDRIRREPNREDSFDSATEDDSASNNSNKNKTDDSPAAAATARVVSIEKSTVDEESVTSDKSPLTAEEEAYTARRSARLKRLEGEGQQLLGTLARNAQRGDAFANKLDTLHERYGDNKNDIGESSIQNQVENVATVAAASANETTNQSQTTTLNIEQRLENIDQVTASRAERLRLLEEEGNLLIARLSSTSERGTRMINRIAEREQRREARLNATPSTEKETETNVASEIAPAVLLPTLKNAACSSIVNDELSECVSIVATATASQVSSATRKTGAIPKSMPRAQLCAARHKSERYAAEKTLNEAASSSTGESLEELVKRLRETPYPEKLAADAVDCEDAQISAINEKEAENSKEPQNGAANEADSDLKK